MGILLQRARRVAEKKKATQVRESAELRESLSLKTSRATQFCMNKVLGVWFQASPVLRVDEV